MTATLISEGGGKTFAVILLLRGYPLDGSLDDGLAQVCEVLPHQPARPRAVPLPHRLQYLAMGLQGVLQRPRDRCPMQRGR